MHCKIMAQIKGTVYDNSTDPPSGLPGVYIDVYDDQGSFVASGSSSIDGRYITGDTGPIFSGKIKSSTPGFNSEEAQWTAESRNEIIGPIDFYLNKS